jgi:hypothetical protein
MEKVAILQVGGSLYFRLPLKVKHKFDLEPGEPFYLTWNKDGTIFKFIRQETADELMPEREEAAVDAA